MTSVARRRLLRSLLLLVALVGIREAKAQPAADIAALEAKERSALDLSTRGEFGKAQRLYVELMQATEGMPRHPLRRRVLLNLGSYYAELFDPPRARPLLEAALQLAQAASDHAGISRAHRWLADCDKLENNFDSALNHLAVATREADIAYAAPNEDKAQIGIAYGELLEALSSRENKSALESALLAATTALNIRESVDSSGPLDVGHALLLRGTILRKKGDLDAAERDLKRAHKIANTHAGPVHPRTSNALGQLRLIAWERRDIPAMLSLGASFEHGLDTHYSNIVTAGSEAQRLKYTAVMEQTTSTLVTIEASLPTDPALREMAFTHVLRHKGRVLDALARAPRASPELNRIRADLASVTLRGPQGQEAAWRANVAKLEAAADALEQKEFETTERRVMSISTADIARSLPPSSALVEVVRYQPFDPNKGPIDVMGPPLYRAYVVKPDGSLVARALGPAKIVEERIRAFRDAIASRADVGSSARSLDEVTLGALADGDLAGVERLFIATDGELASVPFDALRDKTGHHRVERFEVSVLASGRELTATPSPSSRPRSGVTIVANPTFGAGHGRGLLSRVEFEQLPGTAAEASAIAARIKGAQVFNGAAATEAQLKALHGPRILHIATHGYFLSHDNLIAVRGSRGLKLETTQPPRASAAGVEERPPAVNALLRAGLALSNANNGGANTAEDDGVLTGLEASGLDLRGTELVVLSACETGLGENQVGEGVFGLRRAFAIAGAEQLVLSLWKVDDEATLSLMTHFYTELANGKPAATAMRSARLRVMSVASTSHPFFWAPFTVSGVSRHTTGGRAGEVPQTKGCACGVAGRSYPGDGLMSFASAGACSLSLCWVWLIRRSGRGRRSPRRALRR